MMFNNNKAHEYFLSSRLHYQVCFYAGSKEGQDGVSDDGKLLHQVADKRCENFKTCGTEGVDLDGQSKLN